MGSVVQQFVFHKLSNKQEVKTALVTAEHVLPLHTQTDTVRREKQWFNKSLHISPRLPLVVTSTEVISTHLSVSTRVVGYLLVDRCGCVKGLYPYRF